MQMILVTYVSFPCPVRSCDRRNRMPPLHPPSSPVRLLRLLSAPASHRRPTLLHETIQSIPVFREYPGPFFLLLRLLRWRLFSRHPPARHRPVRHCRPLRRIEAGRGSPCAASASRSCQDPTPCTSSTASPRVRTPKSAARAL